MSETRRVPRILYAIQGTGNGHTARAREIIPILERFGEVDILLSGRRSDLKLPFPVRYQREGLVFFYNQQGGLDYLQTFFRNAWWSFFKELLRFPVQDYDLVINDFEAISAWACRWRGLDCLALGHQAAFRSAAVPRPRRRLLLGELILRYYAPASQHLAFHFKSYADGIHPPVIRPELKGVSTSDQGFYLVYLPAYGIAEIQTHLSQLSNVAWKVFHRDCRHSYRHFNIQFEPVEAEAFAENLRHCRGILCSAGFEAPAEALYLGKKLFVIPIAGQYEQACNAAALEGLGIASARELNQRSLRLISDWVYDPSPVSLPISVSDPAALIRAKLWEMRGWSPLSPSQPQLRSAGT